ncbi:hypothetical protein D1BOALGB6SA_5882 [Olavius sp. associated proteobacterium Delta 1]|nr:hypothetical protein D1BOALGB6SA_5882 [Olavius sp. associated proteobacterium Delta 1]
MFLGTDQLILCILLFRGVLDHFHCRQLIEYLRSSSGGSII